jgi:hypothetical protein
VQSYALFECLPNGLKPPATITQIHNHIAEPAKLNVYLCLDKVKETAKTTKTNARKLIRDAVSELSVESLSLNPTTKSLKAIINRERSLKEDYGSNPTDLTFDIPMELHDTGKEDLRRILIFSTNENLKLMAEHRDWYDDGSFDISPTIYKQLFSVHVMINNKALPMVYGLLPDKLTDTYVKRLFSILFIPFSKIRVCVDVFSASLKVFLNT